MFTESSRPPSAMLVVGVITMPPTRKPSRVWNGMSNPRIVTTLEKRLRRALAETDRSAEPPPSFAFAVFEPPAASCVSVKTPAEYAEASAKSVAPMSFMNSCVTTWIDIGSSLSGVFRLVPEMVLVARYPVSCFTSTTKGDMMTVSSGTARPCAGATPWANPGHWQPSTRETAARHLIDFIGSEGEGIYRTGQTRLGSGTGFWLPRHFDRVAGQRADLRPEMI